MNPKTAKKTSQTIAMNLRFYLYTAAPGSRYSAYPHGPNKPVPVEYTDAERADHGRRLGDMLAQWRNVDPEGFALWETAQQTDPAPDPCRFCHSCRTQNTTTTP